MSAPLHFLFQAYGATNAVYQTILAIRSLRHQCHDSFEELRIVVYTDRPAGIQQYLQGYDNLHFEHLNKQRIIDWRGPNDWMGRIKLEILRDYFRLYQAPVCYVECDSVLLKDPMPLLRELSASTSVMHRSLGNLQKPEAADLKKLAQLVSKSDFYVGGRDVKVPATTTLYSNQIIGLHPDHTALLDDVLQLTDQAYRKSESDHADELGLSYLLAQQGQVKTAEAFVFGYENVREEVNAYIGRVLKGELNEGAFFNNTIFQLKQKAEAPAPKKGLWDKLTGK